MRDTQASRHQGIEGSRTGVADISVRPRRTLASSLRRAFSLTEVLLAVFILGIGIISIAALFPAGIAQQRLATDDAMGPIVAHHAMSIIRSRVRPDDFGTFEDYAGLFNRDIAVPQAFFTRTIEGDWGWMRPGFILANDPDTDIDEYGAIDIFSNRFVRQEVHNESGMTSIGPLATEMADGWPGPDFWSALQVGSNDPPLWGIPFSASASPDPAGVAGVPTPPRRLITRTERYYPMDSAIPIERNVLQEDVLGRMPEYVWDCMFRRYQGKVYVAVFVYRVSSPDVSMRDWRVPPNQSNPLVPPLPIALDLENRELVLLYPTGSWDVSYTDSAPHRPTTFVPGVKDAEDLDLDDHSQAWQEHRQWLLDQNMNVHRVVGRRVYEGSNDIQVVVELGKPLVPVRFAPLMNEQSPGINTMQTVSEFFPPDYPPGNPYHAVFNNVRMNSYTSNEYVGNPMQPNYPGGFEDNPTPPFFNWRTSTDRGVVTRLWYIPNYYQDAFGNEWRLTPVYVSVKEL
jgi:hypothetical protein